MAKTLSALCIVLMLSVGNYILAQDSKSTNVIKFESSDYGLIFTMIKVNGHKVKAMIDFGDPHKLQISSKLVSSLDIETDKAGYQVSDITGNTWDVYKGIAEELVVGSWTENDIAFTFQYDEMEGVSLQIGTEFNAVLGWAYFKNYFTEIDYANREIILYQKLDISKDTKLQVPYKIEASQLLFKAFIGEQQYIMMIDTGSPVTVVHTDLIKDLENEFLRFKLGGENVELNAYGQDLSLLSDMGVAVILGGDFLRQYKMIINPEEEVLLFQKHYTGR